jgi:uncharacterized integral membrane protein
MWAISGPFFSFSENWQLIINTSTTIITFLMVFLIQNTQNAEGAYAGDGRWSVPHGLVATPIDLEEKVLLLLENCLL